MSDHKKINYLELPSTNLIHTKAFFENVFDWTFTDYGENYTAFSNAAMEGGFFQSNQTAQTQNGSALVVIYSDNLIETQRKVEEHGGKIVEPIFSFPGGMRFHFTEPSGSELAVWTKT